VSGAGKSIAEGEVPDAKKASDLMLVRPPQRRRRRTRRSREQRRLRLRRHGRRAYIRSVYFLPSLATLGNALCGFGAMYAAALVGPGGGLGRDPLANLFAHGGFQAAAYLVFLAMVFDALDGRLARLARHTTDFGGQLDSLADVVSFGCAPAFIALKLLHFYEPDFPPTISRAIWGIGALYVCCAAIRLARFNVSNEHGEQHHFSFLGLPSPGAAGTVAALILMQQDLGRGTAAFYQDLSSICVAVLPVVVLCCALLMVSNIRYPHMVNRYMRGRRSIGRLIMVVAVVLLLVVAHQYVLGIGTLVYAASGPFSWMVVRIRRWNRPGMSSP
jgi:CDP-diacylglycerol---serine O-phosphatidyltransferase